MLACHRCWPALLHSLVFKSSNTKQNIIHVDVIGSPGLALELIAAAQSRTEQLILCIRVVFM
jgi:hypothetical protein